MSVATVLRLNAVSSCDVWKGKGLKRRRESTYSMRREIISIGTRMPDALHECPWDHAQAGEKERAGAAGKRTTGEGPFLKFCAVSRLKLLSLQG